VHLFQARIGFLGKHGYFGIFFDGFVSNPSCTYALLACTVHTVYNVHVDNEIYAYTSSNMHFRKANKAILSLA
jgi:hypothetical protein